jgi:hypothetical protein
MDLTADLTLDDASGDDVVFKRRRSLPNGSNWINAASTLSEPHVLEILHNETGKGSDVIDRHLVRQEKTVLDSAGVPRKATLNITLAVPRSSAITSQIIYDMVGVTLDLLTDGALAAGLSDTDFISQLLRGES